MLTDILDGLVMGVGMHAHPVAAEEAAQANGAMSSAMDIYLLIGQSNMAGRAPIEAEDEGVLERCFLFTKKNSAPLNIHSTGKLGQH